MKGKKLLFYHCQLDYAAHTFLALF